MIHDIVSYYNATINKFNNPVSFNWLKRQRIIKGRDELNNRFGENTINFIFGEKTYLAKAQDMLLQVEKDLAFDKLSYIGYFLYLECKEMLDKENPVLQKFSSLNTSVSLPILRVYSKYLNPILFCDKDSDISYENLNFIQHYLSEHDDPFYNVLYSAVQLAVFLHLKSAFQEIRNEVELITTKYYFGD